MDILTSKVLLSYKNLELHLYSPTGDNDEWRIQSTIRHSF